MMDIKASGIEQDTTPPEAIMNQLLCGAMMTQAVGVAAKLGIADQLRNGPRSADELAAATNTHAGALYRVLRRLAGAGVFRETSSCVFENTDLSELLRSDVPNSMRASAVFMTEPWHYNVWANMLHSVRTGGTAWKETHGEEVFDWFPKHPDEAETFNAAMTEFSISAAAAVIEAYDFSGIDTLADIAGGHGFLISQILKANPEVKGVLFDMEHVLAGADDLLKEQGSADRVEKVSGDFFKEVPAADSYIMKHIIHDWDDDRAVMILKNIHAAMKGDGKVLLVEFVIPEGNEPHPGKLLDLEMLTSPGGLERTADEFSRLFAAAGFQLSRIVPTRSPFSVIEAVKSEGS